MNWQVLSSVEYIGYYKDSCHCTLTDQSGVVDLVSHSERKGNLDAQLVITLRDHQRAVNNPHDDPPVATIVTLSQSRIRAILPLLQHYAEHGSLEKEQKEAAK